MSPEVFNRTYSKIAQRVQRYGVFPSVALAVAYLESNKPGAGLSGLAEKYNNFHGIQVYPKWTGKTVQLTDNLTGSKRTFCVYNTPAEGFEGFAKFLTDNPRYRNAGVFAATNAADQIKAIAKAGYSETSTWPQAVLRWIDNNYVAVKNPWINLFVSFGIIAALIYFVGSPPTTRKNVYL